MRTASPPRPALGLIAFPIALTTADIKFRNGRADYIDAFWNVLDWNVVESRFAVAIGDTVARLDAEVSVPAKMDGE